MLASVLVAKANHECRTNRLFTTPGFQLIAHEIERLDDYEAIPLDTLRLYRTTAEELRSAMNHRIMDVLITREEKDWNHYGKLRIAEVEQLKLLKQSR